MDPVGAENPAPPEEEEDDDEAESAEAGEKHFDSQVNFFLFFSIRFSSLCRQSYI